MVVQMSERKPHPGKTEVMDTLVGRRPGMLPGAVHLGDVDP